ncbi:hypothetical protein DRO69_08110 [Candidatus Bathyarchaeota archaeon]|nr:MAG: hypothetical protein DRO69_08110 [Candidatus Bathyarchaeota archaeon]
MKEEDKLPQNWIFKKVKALVDFSAELIGVNNLHYPGHPWSIVKLLLLGGWVYVYTTIIPKHFNNYHYVDLLAGSGTTQVKETKDVVPGSPFIPYFLARKPFTKYIYIEKRHDRCEALRQRVSKLIGDKACVLEGDCNEFIESILPEERRSHSLVFIDNEGFDVVWHTIEVILQANTDSLMLFPTSSIMRVAKNERTQSSLDNFFGCKSWRDANDEEESLEIYLQQLKRRFKELRGKEGYVSNVRVGSGQFFYDIVLICKKGPYVRAWEYLKKQLDWKNPEIIKTTLDILKGRATSMDWFLGLQEKVASFEPIRTKKYKETTLDNFNPPSK